MGGLRVGRIVHCVCASYNAEKCFRKLPTARRARFHFGPASTSWWSTLVTGANNWNVEQNVARLLRYCCCPWLVTLRSKQQGQSPRGCSLKKILVHPPKKSKKSEKIPKIRKKSQKSEKIPKIPKIRKKSTKIQKITKITKKS